MTELTDDTAKGKAWLCDGATVYALNANGANLWSMNVQEGFDNKGQRIGNAERERIAALAAAAPNLLAALEWAMSHPALGYSRRIIGQNEHHCDAVDRARAAMLAARGDV